MHGRNVLYVNDGDGTFTDRTDEFGLAHVGYSTQAAFFDYDVDGDLDMYLLNHSTHNERGDRERGDARAARRRRPATGCSATTAGASPTSASAAGIRDGVDGFGLGVVASDLEWRRLPRPVRRERLPGERLPLRQQLRRHVHRVDRAATGHTSRFSMGVDAADINNDGRPDLFVGRHAARARGRPQDVGELGELQPLRPAAARRLPPAVRAQHAAAEPRADAARSARSATSPACHATDWSWAPLFADLDNDGRKDLFVTNGIYRRPNDLDYINYVGNEAVQAALAARRHGGASWRCCEQMPQVPLPNHAFRNDGDLRFTDVAAAWGLGAAGILERRRVRRT